MSGEQPESRGATARGEVQRVELSRRAQSAARRAAESKATIPHFYIGRRIEFEGPRGWGWPGAVLAAVAAALTDHPGLNAGYRDGGVERYSRVNLGLTLETQEGAQVPTVFDADKLTPAEIEARIETLSVAAAEGSLTAADFAGGTFTVTILGDGADTLAPIITPGHCGHIGVGRARPATQANGDPSPTAIVSDLTLACDQRAVRPNAAAAFMERAAELLQDTAGTGS